jgi:hypothetical protein
MSTRRRDRTGLRTLTTVVAERRTLPRREAFSVAGAIAIVAFAANKAVSPLYRVDQAEFRFSATTLTALPAAYILVLLVTLLFLRSPSDSLG